MIVLDTNVISELMRRQPNPAVIEWVSGQARLTLYTTAVNRAEILYGIAVLPAGRRREGLTAAAMTIFAREFAGRVLPFDGAAADQYARIVSSRRQAGRPIEGLDSLIAATAAARSFAVATRDARGFEGCGLKLIDPWTETGA